MSRAISLLIIMKDLHLLIRVSFFFLVLGIAVLRATEELGRWVEALCRGPYHWELSRVGSEN